ncbi:LysR family transcriptional regulator [Nocardia sp. 2]|uniref:LysR family transcriptional regulator n=1 Tax=Nocardia acididurans TaxID=2802282 RepID=A0ABS1M749_9NOCA|nr:LysR family transcriptional regulator [Nocardia acididurans]MBL1075970.1 LysR family transcriptional regulator [Nocardia acididurans]
MERHEIEAFLTLAEELHFRRTSERLGLAQGRVSQTIRKLERRIGVPLFERSSRHVALTPTGRQLRDDLAPAYRAVQQAVARAVEVGKGFSGPVRVGFSSHWVLDLVLRAADRFHRIYPDCRVDTREVQLRDPHGPLRAGEIDLQVTEFPVAEPDLVAGPVLFTEPRALIVPTEHPLAQQDSVSVEDQAELPMVVATGAVPRYWLDHIYPRRTPAGRTISHVEGSGYWLEFLGLVATGRYATPASLRAGQYYARPGITYVPFRDAPPIEYGLIWRRGGDSPRVRAFAETLCELAGVAR